MTTPSKENPQKMEEEYNSSDDESHDEEKTSAMQSTRNELRLLKYTWEDIMSAKKYKCLKKPLGTSDEQLYTIGLAGIDEKFDNYTGLVEFMDDIEALCRSYTDHFSKEANVKKAVESLLEQCQGDVKSITTCPDCFEYWIIDPSNYFTRVCTKPHLLVLAKLTGHPLWPAKVMSIDKNTSMANVEFFGDHTQEDISFDNCYLYAKELIGKTPKNKDLINAIKELKRHTENVVKKFGSFSPANGKVALNGRDLKQELISMFPGAFKKQSAKKTEDESSSDEVEEIDDSSVNDSMAQGEDDKHDETSNKTEDDSRHGTLDESEDNEHEETTTQKEDANATIDVDDDETVDGLSEDNNETSADVSKPEAKTKDAVAGNEPNGDDSGEDSGDESDKESNEQHKDDDCNDSIDQPKEQQNDNDSESENGMEQNRNESNGKRQRNGAKKTDADPVPNKRRRFSDNSTAEDDETQDESSNASLSPGKKETRKPANSNGNAKAANGKVSSSKKDRIEEMKRKINEIEQSKSTALDTLAELKEARKRLKENVNEYNEKIWTLKQNIAVVEMKPVCTTCQNPISEPIFCSDECENNHE
ncbi:MYND-type zinc finger-containing chromatin reader Zmynd8-like [Sitodiplosis mosellana]|uniref:MYND-type zinc finger-containing chromatin reader Zmynd8-like n=1 Tax=Sitodiplosis mosellana TaxID=263140 RepID=UPI002443850C|nr:MYND-type zinc finger-containing chromatin reader Zmynd8-like [Sitodiplosis mosellana]